MAHDRRWMPGWAGETIGAMGASCCGSVDEFGKRIGDLKALDIDVS